MHPWNPTKHIFTSQSEGWFPGWFSRDRADIQLLLSGSLHQHQSSALMWISASRHFDFHCHWIQSPAVFYGWSAQPVRGDTRPSKSSSSPFSFTRSSFLLVLFAFECKSLILPYCLFSLSIHPSIFSDCETLQLLVIACFPNFLHPESPAL